MSDLYTGIDDMTWPNIGERSGELEWMARYANPDREELVGMASIISAYRELLTCSAKKREMIVKELRKARGGK